VDAPPAGEEWIHEIKFDGYRFLARIDRGKVRLVSRNAKDWSGLFTTIEEPLARLPVTNAWLDGEVVALAPDGRHSFQELQRVLKTGTGDLAYYVFDLLHLDGYSLAAVPLDRRKALLRGLLSGIKADSPIRFSDHIDGDGLDTFQNACRLKLEGIVSKRRDGLYRAGRGADWLKTKCQSRQEFIIGGYTDPTGGRVGFGALLIGVRDATGRLVPAGRVGTGFDRAGLTDLHRRLKALEIDASPFEPSPVGARARGVHWVKPVLVAEVEFTEWTSEGQLRHPSFQGLREDKSAAEVVREKPAHTPRVQRAAERATKKAPKGRSLRPDRPIRPKSRPRTKDEPATSTVTITHPDRVVYDTMGITKADLATYYEAVATHMLPHVIERPLALVRCPGGEGKGCFYQKHLGTGAPKAIRSVAIEESSASGEYPWIRDVDGLVGLVQMGVLEIHPWGSRVSDIEKPDRIIFDIDPDPKLAWRRVAALAFRLRERLEELGLESWLKTTGGKGVHVVVPIQRRHEWPVVKAFAQAIAQEMARNHPDEVTSVMSKAKRVGRIFLDYLRNGRGATAIAAYSTRARPGAPVAVPIAWEELTKLGRADSFNVKNLPKRLALLTFDPWAKLAASRQGLSQRVLASLAID
jgi:bifunctional non-homologous end joining protein LigD